MMHPVTQIDDQPGDLGEFDAAPFPDLFDDGDPIEPEDDPASFGPEGKETPKADHDEP